MLAQFAPVSRPEVELAIVRLCAGATSPREACTAALSEVQHALRFSCALVYQVYGESELEIVTVFPRAIAGIEAGVQWKPVGRERAVITSAEPAIEGELPRDGETFTSWRLARFGMRSSVRVPLFSAGSVVGGVEIYSHDPAAFSVSDAIALESYISPLGEVLSERQRGEELPSGSDVAAVEPRGGPSRPPPRDHPSNATAERLALLEQFGAAVAHELNNPLATVLGYAQLLDSLPEAERRAAIPVMVEQAERSGAILRELLAFSRPRPLRREPLDINAVLARELSALRRRDRPLELQLAVIDDVSGDAQALPEAMRRVLTYCYEYSERGGPIRVSSALGTDSVRLAISGGALEDGEDLSPSEPFAPTGGAWAIGSLNLLQAYRVIHAHGGTIRATEGVNAINFEIELPAFPRNGARYAQERTPSARVVVAARDSGIVRLITAILEAEGFVPIAVSSWEDAIAGASDADLLLVDQAILSRSFDATYVSRQGDRSTPLVVLRDSGGAALRTAALRVRYLDRPFTAEELLHAVREAIGGA